MADNRASLIRAVLSANGRALAAVAAAAVVTQLAGASYAAAAVDGTGPSHPAVNMALAPETDDSAPAQSANINVAVSAPEKVLIGEEFTFTVTFDHTGGGAPADTGWGPFVDIVLDAGGEDLDAAHPDYPTTPIAHLDCDGVSFVAAQAAPSTGPTTVLGPFPSSTCGAGAPPAASQPHPYGFPAVNPGLPGFQLVTAEFPVGAYTASEPALVMIVTAKVHGYADRHWPLQIRARGGFKYGVGPAPAASPPGPGADPVVQGDWQSAAVTPDVLCVTKKYLGPQDEAVSGPNFVDYYPLRYRIEVDIADGVTVQNLEIRDQLPKGLVYDGNAEATPPGATVTPATSPLPAALVIAKWPSVTGAAGGPDAVLEFDFYIPAKNAPPEETEGPSNPGPVVDLSMCDFARLVNDIWVLGKWWPPDPRDQLDSTGQPTDEPVEVFVDQTPEDHVLWGKCLAIQKSVELAQNTRPGADGYTPLDIVEYSIPFQVSDYATFGNIVITDTLGNGHELLTGEPITLMVTDRYGTTEKTFTPGENMTIKEDPDLDELSCQTYPGGTEIVFDVAAALADTDNPAPAVVVRHSMGVLTGGHAWLPASTTPAHGLIKFRARIKDTYDALDEGGEPGATDPIDKHDPLVNCVEIHGMRHSNAERDEELMGLLVEAQDMCSSLIQIIPPETSKDIVYVNGEPVLAGDGAFGVDPGDEVTFAITHWIPSGDAENLVIRDWLPQPVMSVAGMPSQSSPAALPLCGPLVPMPPPVAGACYLPAGLSNAPYGPFAPTWSGSPSDQSVTFDFGTMNSPVNAPVTLEVYVTVKVTNEPFPDGMHLDNLANVCETDSWGKLYCQTVIRELSLRQPSLRIRKGIVSVAGNPEVTYDPADPVAQPPGSAPIFPPGVVFGTAGAAGCPSFTGTISSSGLGAQPGVLDSDVYGADAGDVVRYAVVVENTGSSTHGAFDVRVQDALPPQLINPTNLCVADGTGAAMAYTVAGTGFFGSGAGNYIQLDDPGYVGDPGALDRYSANGGRNIAVITFDATVADALVVGQCQTNWAHTLQYAGQEGGPDHVSKGLGGPHSDAALLCALPRPAKWIVATSEGHTPDGTADTQADPRPLTMGEIVRYRLQVAIPEGHTADLQLVDTLPVGLQLLEGNPVVNQTGIVFTSDTPMGVETDFVGAPAAPPIPPALSPIPPPGIAVPPSRIGVVGDAKIGQELTFDLGTIDNTDSDPDLEYATLDFNALVLNSFAPPPNDTSSANDRGDARPNHFDVKVAGAKVAESAAVHAVIVEPGVELAKQVRHGLDGTNWQNHAVEYTLVVENTDHLDGRDATAFEVEVTDQLGACLNQLIGQPVAVRSGGGNSGVVVTVAASGMGFTVTIDRLAVGESVSITYRSTIKCPVCPDLANDARVTWTGLPGAGTSPNATRSTTPGASGAWNGERTGAGPTLNDYFGATSLSLCGRLCGTKFQDTDGDGAWDDPPEPSLSGWTIGAAAGLQTWASVITPYDGLDPNEPGAYCLTVIAGAYTVSETLSDQMKAMGWQQTAPSGGGTHQANVASGQTITGLDFGNRQCAQTVGGVKFHDLNGNGVRDSGEPGVGGWTIFAVRMSPQPSVTLTAVTAADGSYSFPLGLPGQWWITEEPRAGWIRTFPIWPEGPQIPGSIASYPAGGYAAPIETCTVGFGVRPILTPPIPQTSLNFGNKLAAGSCPSGWEPRRIVAWGDDTAHYGEIGGIPATQSPVFVAGKFIAVAAGGSHTLALAQDGSIHAWGSGAQVTQAPAGAGFIAVAAGHDTTWAQSGQSTGGHSLAIDASNHLWGWGSNGRGQLPGHAPGSAAACSPANQQCIEDSRLYRAITAGREHSVAIDQNGDLHGWGSNAFGQLPGSCSTQAATCTQAGSFVAVAATASATIALDEDGDLHGWGDNSSSALPGGCASTDKTCTLAGDFTSVAAGFFQVLAVDGGGKLTAWGFDSYGEVSGTPSSAGWLAGAGGAGISYALASDRTLTGWGQFEGDIPPIDPPLGRYAQIAAGGGEIPDHEYRAHAVAIQCEELPHHMDRWAVHLPAVLDKAPIARRIIPDRRE